jgi:hypothetical protein
MIQKKRFRKLAVTGYPAWGTPAEVLKYHGLDGQSIAKSIIENCKA